MSHVGESGAHSRRKKIQTQISAPWFLRGENRLLGYGNELWEIVSHIESFFFL